MYRPATCLGYRRRMTPDWNLPRRTFVTGAVASSLLPGCHRDRDSASPSEAASEASPVVPVTRVVPPAHFVSTRGTQLVRDGRPYYMTGFNYWSAVAESRTPQGRERVRRELTQLAAMGVSALRVLAMFEGPDDQPWRIRPSLQPRPGVFTPEGMDGLAWFLAELTERNMVAVLTLTNFWFWSGGMPQYLAWAGGGSIPYPNPEGGGDWDAYQNFSASFFAHEKAQALFRKAIDAVVLPHKDSPAVLAWELANEPRGRNHAADYRKWIGRTAEYIKKLDGNHLVTTGSEGDTPWPEGNGLDLKADHASDAIDIVSFHVWPENWSWTRPGRLREDFDQVAALATRYIEDQVRKSEELGKPVLLLETGLARDDGSFEPSARTTFRDRYFDLVFDATHRSVQSCGALAGTFPWAWSGEGLPEQPGGVGQQGMFTGDPPHERQGWYSVYAEDVSTVELVTAWSGRVREAVDRCPTPATVE